MGTILPDTGADSKHFWRGEHECRVPIQIKSTNDAQHPLQSPNCPSPVTMLRIVGDCSRVIPYV